MKKYPHLRELTEEEKVKYKIEIEKSRKSADSYVFGYKKKEVYCTKTDTIKTLAMGENKIGWIPVGFCKLISNNVLHIK
jgi:hypothetical protein